MVLLAVLRALLSLIRPRRHGVSSNSGLISSLLYPSASSLTGCTIITGHGSWWLNCWITTPSILVHPTRADFITATVSTDESVNESRISR